VCVLDSSLTLSAITLLRRVWVSGLVRKLACNLADQSGTSALHIFHL
jgi:hypothetical protein